MVNKITELVNSTNTGADKCTHSLFVNTLNVRYGITQCATKYFHSFHSFSTQRNLY